MSQIPTSMTEFIDHIGQIGKLEVDIVQFTELVNSAIDKVTVSLVIQEEVIFLGMPLAALTVDSSSEVSILVALTQDGDNTAGQLGKHYTHSVMCIKCPEGVQTSIYSKDGKCEFVFHLWRE